MRTSSSNLDLIRGAYEAFGRGDVPAVLGLMDETIAWHEADGFPWGGTHHGPDAVLNDVFLKIAAEWEGFQGVPEEYIDGGDTIVVLGYYSGTYKKTGQRARLPFATVWRITNGKVSEFRQYTDTAPLQRTAAGAQRASAT